MLSFYYDKEKDFDPQVEITIQVKNGYYENFGTVDSLSLKTLFNIFIEEDKFSTEFNLVGVEEKNNFTAIKFEGEDLYDSYFLLMDMIVNLPEDVYTYFICSPIFDFYYKYSGEKSIPLTASYILYTSHDEKYILLDTYKDFVSKFDSIQKYILNSGESFEKTVVIAAKIHTDKKYIQDLEKSYKEFIEMYDNIMDTYDANKDLDSKEIIKKISKLFGDDSEIFLLDYSDEFDGDLNKKENKKKKKKDLKLS